MNSSIWYFERCVILSRGLSWWTIYVVDPLLKHLIKLEIIWVCDMHSNIDNKIIRVCFMWSFIISNFKFFKYPKIQNESWNYNWYYQFGKKKKRNYIGVSFTLKPRKIIGTTEWRYKRIQSSTHILIHHPIRIIKVWERQSRPSDHSLSWNATHTN